MFGIGPLEFVVILVMALLVLGPKRMPELARTLGRGLGEFRRASSELRQSLALDDLQNELRQGLNGSNTIHKRDGKTDRPAQAGDDLASGKKPEVSESDDTSKQTSKQNAEPEAKAQSDATAPRSHPGELPLDEDPHAHHDEASQAAQTPTARRAVPADSKLGNVPVGGAPTTATAPPSATPPTSDDERG